MVDKVTKFIRDYDLDDEMEDLAHINSVDDIESAIKSAKTENEAKALTIYHMNTLIKIAASAINKLTEQEAEENIDQDEEDGEEDQDDTED